MTITCQGQPREQAETERDNPPELSPSEPYPMEQRLPGKSYDPLSSLKVICYRCQGLGHIAKVCPFKSLVKEQSLERTNRKNCENSVELNTPNASISHLSLPKDVEIGLGVTSKETAPARSVDHTSKPELTPLLIQTPERKTESDLRTLLIKEEPPDSCQRTTRHQAPELGVIPAAYSPSQFEAGHDTRGEEERPKEKRLDHDKNTNSVQQRAKEPMVTNRTSTKGAPAKPDQSRGVILFYLLKGEPPDVPNITKPQAYRGKTLNSQRRMKANLLSLGAGSTVSRSKPFQEGENDEDIRSSSDQEHGKYPRELTKTLGEDQPERTKDIGVFLGAYRPNLKKLSHESNCSRNSTHQGIHEIKNRVKSFLQDEVIQLSSWQTANDLEGDQRLPIEGFQSNQDEPSHKPTCFGNSTHQRCKTNWIHAKTTYGLKVIQLLNQVMPDLPCLGVHELKRLLRLPLLIMHDLEVFHTVPRHHLYLPKLSRYKGHSKSC